MFWEQKNHCTPLVKEITFQWEVLEEPTPQTLVREGPERESVYHGLTARAAAGSPQEHLSAPRHLLEKQGQRSAVLRPLVQPVTLLPLPC